MRPPNAEPSEQEIAAECERIRETWTAKVRESRRVGGVPEQWTPPEYNAAALGLAVEIDAG